MLPIKEIEIEKGLRRMNLFINIVEGILEDDIIKAGKRYWLTMWHKLKEWFYEGQEDNILEEDIQYLEDKGLIEHKSSAGSSWFTLTQKGIQSVVGFDDNLLQEVIYGRSE